MPTEIGKIFPKAASTSRQERLVSEWGLTSFINGIAAWCNGTFWLDADRTKCFIHGYYCELNSSADSAYILVNKPDNDWFIEVQGPFSGSGSGSGVYSITSKSPVFDSADHFLNALMSASSSPIYVVLASEPDKTDKRIWINSANRYIPYVVVGLEWVPLGAVYK